MSEVSNESDEADKKEETTEELEDVSEEVEATESLEEQPTTEEEAEAEPEAREEREEAEEPEEEIEIVEERIYTIPFRRAWATPRGKRTPHAMRMLRDFVRRHMKTEDVKISNEVNEELWARSIKKPPHQIKVRLVKDKEGRVIVYPAAAS